MSQQGQLITPSSLETLTGNDGGPVEPDGSGNISIVGSPPINVSGNPGTNTLTITDDGTIAITFTCDTGSATPAANNLNVLGDSSQGSATSGATDTITITNLDATTSQKGVLETATDAEAVAITATDVAIVPANLGPVFSSPPPIGNSSPNTGSFSTLTVTSGTENAIPVFGTGGLVSEIGPLTDGQLVIGSTGMSPVAANLTSTGATVTITNGAGSINLEAAASVAITFDGDSGSATPAANVITFAGGTGLTSSAAGSTVTYDLDTPVTVANGGTGATTLTDGGILLGSGTAAITATSQPTDGQLLIGSTGVDPVLATLASSGSTVAITNGAGTINLETGDAVPVSFSTDSGSAVPSSGILTIAGGTLLGTTGSGSTVTVNADDNVVGSVASDSGTATPSSNSFTITGTAGITTSASGSTVTIIGTGEQIVAVTSLDNTDSPYTVLTTDYYLSCDVSAGTLEIDLPNAPTTGSIWIVKDSGGDAASNNITVTTVGGVVTIDGATTFVMNTDYEAANFIFNGTSYEVF